MAEPDLLARGEAEVVPGGSLEEVFTIDVDDAAHRHRAGALFADVGGPVRRVRRLHVAFGPGLHHHAERAEDGEDAGRAQVQVLAQRVLEEGDLDEAVVPGDADTLAEGAESLGGDAAAAEPGDGGHARIVPAIDQLLLHELEQLALAHHRVGEVEAGKLGLLGAIGQVEREEEPVVEIAVVLELEGADRVGDAFNPVREAVGKIVERVDAPVLARAVMLGVADAVDRRIAELHVGVGHVDPRADDVGAVGELAFAHPLQEIEVLFHGAGGVGAEGARLADAAAVFADLFLGERADVGLAAADELDRKIEELLVIVRGVEELVAPVEAEPAHVALNRLDVLQVFRRRVGVVEAEVASAVEVEREAEVQADRFGVADVEVAVGLRRKAGDDAAPVLVRGLIRLHEVADEVRGARVLGRCRLSVRSFFARRGHDFDQPPAPLLSRNAGDPASAGASRGRAASATLMRAR